MKKCLSFLLALLLIASASAMAEDLGVIVINNNNAESVPATLDDMQLNVAVEIENYAEITPLSYEVTDCFLQRAQGVTGNMYHYSSEYDVSNEKKLTCDCVTKDYPWIDGAKLIHNESKTQADYILFMMDVLNTTNQPKNFIKECSVVVVFNDNIEYAGWARQRNEDWNFVKTIDPADNFIIDPYYIGHYVFGCTLPNTVISSKKPLRMVITIDENEITYNIRK